MKLFERLLNRGDSNYGVKTILRWLWHVLKGNRRQAVFNAAIGLLGVGTSLILVWAMQHTIDIATSGHSTTSIVLGVALMGAIIVSELVLNLLLFWIKNILGVKAQNQMQQQMLDRLLRAEWHSKSSRHSGDIINRLEQDVKTVVNFVTETLPKTLSTLAMFVGAFFYLLQMDVWLACITVGILPVFITLSRIYVNQMRKYTKRVRTSDSRIQSILQEVIQHRMLIKTLEASGAMVGKLDNSQTELRQHVRQRTKFSIVSHVFVSVGFSLGYLVAFLWGAVRLSARTITYGQMTAFLQLVYRIQNPARDMVRLAPAFVEVFTAAERLMELEETPQETQGQPVELAAPAGIRFDRVDYIYDDGTETVLSQLSFDFRPGSCTAILGETGVGKTTLVRLILALVRPTRGNITIYSAHQSMPVTPLHRCNFVYVPQGNTLLSGTIRDNLLLGNPQASETQMIEALHAACADFVTALPKGLDTVCSEAGGGLSEGQAQRIAIARALLRNRPIMLFDEATSALDPDTERQLLTNVLTNHQHTIIFITHRPAVVDYCDQVLRL